jgi:two-component system, cell cycle sensor histidine kinase and response regulator CckA
VTLILSASTWYLSTNLERTKAEVSKQASELEVWGDVFQNAAFGIAVVDGTTEAVRFANPAFADMLGVTPDEIKGMPILDAYPVDERARLASLARFRDSSGTVSFESQHVRKDGSTYPVQMHVTAVRNANGAVRYRIASAFDITARRQAEEQLRQAQKMEAIGSLTGGMAHDFNNLLGVVIANLDLAIPLLEATPEPATHVGEALEAALRGAELTRRLLAFARRQPLRPRNVDLNGLVSEMVKLLRRTLGEQIEITLNLEKDVWPVIVDPSQFEAVLMNLSNNARDAMPAGGRLIIATRNRTLDTEYAALHSEVVPGDYVMTEVSDSGTGIKPDILNQIFEPFFTTKEIGKGTGLGLSMVFGFMKQSGGHIDVYSEPHVGTTVRLYLPRGIAVTDDAPDPSTQLLPRGDGETVLVVEDNAALRRVLVRQLEQLGYRVFETDRAAGALITLENEQVDLLITDIVMPGEMDGFALAGRALAHWPRIKVLLTSGFPDAKINGHLGSKASSTRLLSKPYRKQDLAVAIREVLDDRKSDEAPR